MGPDIHKWMGLCPLGPIAKKDFLASQRQTKHGWDKACAASPGLVTAVGMGHGREGWLPKGPCQVD